MSVMVFSSFFFNRENLQSLCFVFVSFGSTKNQKLILIIIVDFIQCSRTVTMESDVTKTGRKLLMVNLIYAN